MKDAVKRLFFRKIKEKELPSLVELVHKTISYSQRDYPEKIKKYFIKTDFNGDYLLKRYQEGEVVLWGAFKNEELVGFLITETPYGGTVYLDWVGIEPNHQRQGFGKEMMGMFMEVVKKGGTCCVYLFCPSSGKLFYQKCGFKDNGLIKNFFFGQDHHFMIKYVI